MATFQKKVELVEAVQFSPDEAVQFFPDSDDWPDGVFYFLSEGGKRSYWVNALNSRGSIIQQERVGPGDWIITTRDGERYSCRQGVFEATYEPVMTKEEVS